ncbi:MAG: hypothetical protein WDW36_006416 [Sanguina aurantia]
MPYYVQAAGDAAGSGSSTQRNTMMKEKLEHVKESLDQLVPPQASAAPAFNNVLDSMASRLSSMEGMYSEVSGRLVDNERQVKELQHFQADTIHETDRIVQYIGSKAPSPSRPSSMSTAQSPLPQMPPSATSHHHHHNNASSTSAPGTGQRHSSHSSTLTRQPHQIPQSPLEYVPANVQIGATIQQHASQIHKLIAGLDFLEAHIIRQDQVIEGMQASVSAGTRSSDLSSGRSPSEASVRLHDLSELVNKIRSHMYKVRLRRRPPGRKLVCKQQAPASASWRPGWKPSNPGPPSWPSPPPHVPGLNGDPPPPAFTPSSSSSSSSLPGVPAPGVASPRAPQQRDEMAAQVAQLMRQVPVLVAENAELRQAAVRSAAAIEDLRAGRAGERAAAASTTQELTQLRSQLFEAFERIEATQSLAQESALAVAGQRSAAPAAAAADPATAEALQALQLDVAALTVRVTELAAVASELPAVVDGLQQGQQRATQMQQELESVKAQSAAAAATAAAAVLRCDSSGVSSSIAQLAEGVQLQQQAVVEQVQELISELREQQDLATTTMASDLEEKHQAVRQHVGRLDMELSVQRVQLQQQVAAVAEEQQSWQEGFNGELRGRLDGLLDRIRERLDGQIAQVTSQVSAHEQLLSGAVMVDSLPERLSRDSAMVEMADGLKLLASEVSGGKQQASAP